MPPSSRTLRWCDHTVMELTADECKDTINRVRLANERRESEEMFGNSAADHPWG